jgi:hypothetical protein
VTLAQPARDVTLPCQFRAMVLSSLFVGEVQQSKDFWQARTA